jgi:RHS repeat-associated protein
MELDPSNDVAVRRVFGSGFDNPIGRVNESSDIDWYGTDRQSTVRQIFDTTGTETHALDYDAFGIILNGTSVDRYGFQGREHDSFTGLRHHRARETNGQFWLSEDPIGFAAGDANLNRYVGNGSTNASDPSGKYLVIDRNEDFPGFEAFLVNNGIRFTWFNDGRGYFLNINPEDRSKFVQVLKEAGWSDTVITMIMNAAFYERDEKHLAISGSFTGTLMWDYKDWGTRVVKRYMDNQDKLWSSRPAPQFHMETVLLPVGISIIQQTVYYCSGQILLDVLPGVYHSVVNSPRQVQTIYIELKYNGHSSIDAAVLTLLHSTATLSGIASIDEAIRGTDIRTGETLTSLERWQRGIMGIGQLAGTLSFAVSIINRIMRLSSAPKNNPIQGLPRTGSALKTDPYHAFPDVIDNFAANATGAQLRNGATLYQVEGSLNGVAGRFEWIVDGGKITHRMFVKGGTCNGVPIKP